MKALVFIALQNMKKKKGDTFVFFFLIALAVVLLYTSISVFLGLDVVLDRTYERAHTADLFFMSSVDEESIAEILQAQDEVIEYEASESLYFIEIKQRKEGETEEKQIQMFLGKIDEERNIGKLVGIETKEVAYDALVLPYYMKASEGYDIGDTCYLTIGNEEYRFEVIGFSEDPLFATPLNVSVYGSYISSACMEDMIKDNPVAQAAKGVQHKVRLMEGESSFEFDNHISAILTQEIPGLSDSINLGLNWESMKDGVSIMSKITMGILLIFSLLLMTVVLIIIHFSIRNYVEMNLKNIGILQAAGYTSNQLNIAVLLEMGIIAFGAIAIGILVGVAGNGLVGFFEGIMIGLSWNQGFHVTATFITVIVIFSIVLLAALFSGRIYKKISVLEALRGGIHTHNFKKNYFSFEKTKLPIPLTLAMKNFFHEKMKNISIFCIVMILAFSTCVGFGLYGNFAKSNDSLLKLIGAEAGNLMLTGANLDEMGEQIEAWDEIDSVLYYINGTLQLESQNEETSVSCDFWKDPELVRNEMIIEGRLPKYENEIMLTRNIAKRLGVDVGDTIYVTGQKQRMDFLVCGIDQKINNMGLKAFMSYKGMERLNGIKTTSFLYIYTKEGIHFGDISEKILNEYPDVSVTDSEQAVGNIIQVVMVSMTAICMIFVLITIFVVVMVELLLVKSKVIRERRNLGLSKALGFTTGQLIIQTMFINIPVIILGAVCGCILSIYLMEPLVVGCLSFVGIAKYPFVVNVQWMSITVAGIVLVALIASFVSSIKIRKIEPVKMLVEE